MSIGGKFSKGTRVVLTPEAVEMVTKPENGWDERVATTVGVINGAGKAIFPGTSYSESPALLWDHELIPVVEPVSFAEQVEDAFNAFMQGGPTDAELGPLARVLGL